MDSKKLFTTAIATTLAATAVVPAAFAASTTATEADLNTAKALIDGKEVVVAATAATPTTAEILTAVQALGGTNTVITALVAGDITFASGKATIALGTATDGAKGAVTATVTVKTVAEAAKEIVDGKSVIVSKADFDFATATGPATTGSPTADEIATAKAAVLTAIKQLDTAETKNTVLTGVTLKSINAEGEAVITLGTAGDVTVNVASAEVVNNGSSADTITVKGLANDDVVNVYTSATEAKAIGTAKVKEGVATVSVKALEAGKDLYFAITPKGSKEQGAKFGPTKIPVVEQTDRKYSATVYNKAGVKKDVVTVLGVKAKDVVNVYTKYTAATSTEPAKYDGLIGTAKVSKSGAVDVKIKEGFDESLITDPTASIPLYVTVTEFDKSESTHLGDIKYTKTKQSETTNIKVETSNLVGAKNDTITFYNVKAKDIINIYSKKTSVDGVTPITVAEADLVQTVKVSKDAAALTVKIKDKAKVGFTVTEPTAKDGSLLPTDWFYTRTALDEAASEPVKFTVKPEKITDDRGQGATFTNNVKGRDLVTLSGASLVTKDIVKLYDGALAETATKPAKPVLSVGVKQAGPVVLTLKTQPELGTVFTYSITKAGERESFGLSTVVGRTATSTPIAAEKTLLNDNGAKAATLTVIDTVPKAVYTVYEGTTEIGKAAAKGGILTITLKDKLYTDLKNVNVTVTEVDKLASQPTVVRNLEGNSVTTVAGLKTLLEAIKIPTVTGTPANEVTPAKLPILTGLTGTTVSLTADKAKIESTIETKADGTAIDSVDVTIATVDESEIAALELVTKSATVFEGADNDKILAAIKALDPNNKTLKDATITSTTTKTDRVKVKIGTKEVYVGAKFTPAS